MKKVGTVIYAVGWTQHSFGTQIIRTAAMLQLLLGNVGRAGGGVNALRGHSNIQGATDMAGVFDSLPGYLKVPDPTDKDFKAYIERITPKTVKPAEWDSFNYCSNTSKFAVSLLKAMYGRPPPRKTTGHSITCPKWTANTPGRRSGTTCTMARSRAACLRHERRRDWTELAEEHREALKKADWLVVGEIYPDETSNFWNSPGIKPEEMKNIRTEVYRLPGAGFAEKDGTFVNSARWLQWKWAAVPPPGEAKLDHEILARIFLEVRELYKQESGAFPDPILNLAWNYTVPENPSLSEVARELNGRAVEDVTDKARADDESGSATAGLLLAARRRVHFIG